MLIVAKEALWLAKPEIVTLSPSTVNVCWACVLEPILYLLNDYLLGDLIAVFTLEILLPSVYQLGLF